MTDKIAKITWYRDENKFIVQAYEKMMPADMEHYHTVLDDFVKGSRNALILNDTIEFEER